MIAKTAGVTYRYPRAHQPALTDVTLTIDDGERVLVAGPSAGGKSTLLRLFNGLIPHFHGGALRGSVEVLGQDTATTPPRNLATVAGMVFQEPEAQGIADTVEDEVAFGMEQLGVAPAVMRQRIATLLGALGIDHLRHRRLATLSGGERQRVAIASVLALQPALLLLDEPTSQLDPDGAQAVLDALENARRELGLAVVIAEHRVERLLPWADVVLLVDGGRVRGSAPREAALRLPSVPGFIEVAKRLGIQPVPLSVEEFRRSAARLRVAAGAPPSSPGDLLARVENLTVRFGEQVALRGVSLELREGEVVALAGPNGSGKTTLLRAITGLVQPASGTTWLRGVSPGTGVRGRTAVAGLVPQDPALAFYLESVRDEVGATLRHRGKAVAVEHALHQWNVGELSTCHPRSLSVGQQQRAAIATMLAHDPPVWLLDEPTRGVDGPTRAWLAQRLREHAARGGAAIMATHDVEAAAGCATRAVILREGALACDLPAAAAFGTGGPLETSVAAAIPGARTAEDVEWA